MKTAHPELWYVIKNLHKILFFNYNCADIQGVQNWCMFI